MNRTIYAMARRNIIKNKKHYLIVSIIVFIVSVIMFSYIICNDNQYQLLKRYNEKVYGSWYVRIENIDEFSKELLENYIAQMKEDYRNDLDYGYIKQQGKYKNYQIASLDESIYDLCHIEIVKGYQPKNADEILVSASYAKAENADIGNQLIHNGKSLTIVGIVHTNNEGLPDIYTCMDYYETLDYYANMELPKSDKGVSAILYDDENNQQQICYLFYKNNLYGYDHNIANENVNDANDYIYFYAEITGITFFILFILTSSSLRKRVKEMSLLRGIGMTVDQMVKMIIIENILICTLSIILGLLISMAISFGFVYYQSLIYHDFVYSLNFTVILISAILLVFCVFISSILPIISSSKNALSGSFDSYRFQYFQVRYRKLKKQSLSYLALRELIVNKKINISFFVFVIMFSFYGIVGFYSGYSISDLSSQVLDDKNYVEIYLKNEEQAQIFKNHFTEETLVYPYISIEGTSPIECLNLKGTVYRFGIVGDTQWFNSKDIEGNMPLHSHEILVGQTISNVTLKFQDNPDLAIQGNTIYIDDTEYNYNSMGTDHDEEGNIIAVTIPIESPNIGEKIIINDEEYTVTGKITNDIFNSSESSLIFLYQDDYQNIASHYTVNYYGIHGVQGDDYQEVNVFLKNQYEDEQYYFHEMYYQFGMFDDFEFNIEFLIAVIVVGIMLMLFLNYNNIENNYQDYQLYHILGVSYEEIKKKQLWKSYHMFFITALIDMIYFIILVSMSQDRYIPLLQLMGLLAIIFVLYLIVYNLPLYLVMKNHKNEELRNNE